MSAQSAATVEVTEAFLHGSASGRVGAAYATIRNTGKDDVRVVAAHSPSAARIELHDVAESDDGVVRMQEIASGVPLPAGETLRLVPGGRHLMLMGIVSAPRPGDSVEVVLVLDDGREIAMDATVRARPGRGASHGESGRGQD